MGHSTRPVFRRFVSAVAVAAVLTLTLVGSAWAKPPSVVHTVSAGGPDACAGLGAKPGCDGNYSLTAKQFADGSATGEYHDSFGRHGGINGVIDCVVVVGNQAWISGWVKSGRFDQDDLTGLPFTTRLSDNGRSAKDPPDQISSSNTGDPTPCTDMAAFDLLDAPQGQVTIK